MCLCECVSVSVCACVSVCVSLWSVVVCEVVVVVFNNTGLHTYFLIAK